MFTEIPLDSHHGRLLLTVMFNNPGTQVLGINFLESLEITGNPSETS